MSHGKKTSSPFAALAELREALPPGPERAEVEEAPTPVADVPFAGRIVVARTRKGRGGKTVTTIRGVIGDAAALAAIARELKKALGCGVTVEGAELVLQGEQSERARAFLEARGARRITIGS